MSLEDDILIENYLKGLLTENEETSFLERLISDAEFKEKFKLEEQLFNTLNDESWSFLNEETSEVEAYKKLLQEDDLQNLKKTLSQRKVTTNESSSQGNKKLIYYLVAASVVLFLGFQFFFNSSKSNIELYNEYLALNDLPSFVSRSNDATQLADAQHLFENKKYKEALGVFNTYTNKNEDQATVLLYKGLAETELGQYNVAEETFDKLINSKFIDAEKGYWYKALLFVKANRIEDAKTVLITITSKNLYNNNKAKALLESLNEN